MPPVSTTPFNVPAESSPARRQSYGDILKSSVLIGGSSVLRIGLGIIRTKALALMIGPSGIGLLGIYQSIVELSQNIAGMGINNSGVRQIAEAVSAADERRVAYTVISLRRIAFLLGALGALLLAVFCRQVSHLTFGDYHHAGAVAFLALAVFCGAVSSGQLALVQGMRQIAYLARSNVLGALYGTVLSIVIVYFLRERGIVLSLFCVGLTAIGTSWWYSRKTRVAKLAMTLADVFREASELLKLGFVFMLSGLMGMGAAYVVRILVVRNIGVEAAGFYQSAWTLGGLYVGIVLQAMGADFFPRLTAVAKDNKECNRLVNEQAEVSLLMAGPGIIGTLTFAPLVILLFYSAKFGPAVEVLRWIALGMMLRVASWPMGFILLAKGTRQPYFWSESSSALVQCALVFVCIKLFGLAGTGIAFFAGYIFYWCLIYAITRSMSGFRWSAENRRIGAMYGVLIAIAFVSWYFLPPMLFSVVGSAITAGTGIYSLRRLCTLVPMTRLPRFVVRVLERLRIIPEAGVAR